MLDQLLLPFQFPFMVKGMIITMTVAIPMALLSCFMVLKGWSLMGDAISHAVFPGIVLAYMAGLPLAIGAFAAGLFSSIATGFLQANSRIKQDTVMGIVFSGMFAVGLVIFTNIESEVHLNHILFGHLLGVSWQDIGSTALIAGAITLVLVMKWRDFLLFIFDPIEARAVGLRVKLLHYGLLTMISLAIVAALKAVGIILSISLLIAPGAIAFLVTRKLSTMMIVAVSVGVASAFFGVYFSLFIGSDSAATIVLFETVLFIIAFIRASIRARKAEHGLESN